MYPYPTNIPAVLRNRMRRAEHRNRYLDLRSVLQGNLDDLAITEDPDERARILGAAARDTERMASLHQAAWGNRTDGDGRPMHESLAASAALLRQVAETERGVLISTWVKRARTDHDPQLRAWTALAHTSDPASRVTQLRHLQHLCAAQFGHTAAAVLGLLADLDDRRARRRDRRGPWAAIPPMRPTEVVGIIEVTLVTLILVVPAIALTARVIGLLAVLAVCTIPMQVCDRRARSQAPWRHHERPRR
ncbi:hypothetical protein [Actinomadura sp. 3N407]|uniref:hypothetical protein n=1 Tax=Actinomadura sp. 3N407 TaxID=3457423 RepID=UPI003FCCF451